MFVDGIGYTINIKSNGKCDLLYVGRRNPLRLNLESIGDAYEAIREIKEKSNDNIKS